MANFSIDTFTSQLNQGGALASLFECKVTGWAGVADVSGAQTQWGFMCNGAVLPPSTITPATVTYMGRALQIPGNRDAAQLTTSVYNDETMEIRNYVENWMEKINSQKSNKRHEDFIKMSGDTAASYTGTMVASQLKKDGSGASKSYKFHNIWPSTCPEIAMSWDTNEIQAFDVVWEYSYWSSTDSGAGA